MAFRVRAACRPIRARAALRSKWTRSVLCETITCSKNWAAGGMGTVYKARHQRLKRIVALKLLPPDRTRDKRAVARFEREMEAVGKLEHPNIVRALDAGEHDGTHYLVMEYVDGLDLSQLVRRLLGRHGSGSQSRRDRGHPPSGDCGRGVRRGRHPRRPRQGLWRAAPPGRV